MKRVIAIILAGLGVLLVAGCANAATSSSTSAASNASSLSAVSSSSEPASSTSASAGKTDGSALPEEKWGDYFAVLGDDAVAFGRRVQTELPVKAYACYQGEGGGEPIWFEDQADIVSLFNALAATNAAGDAAEVRTDDYTSFGFEFADGTRSDFTFDSMTFMVQEGNSWKIYAIAPNPALEAYADQAKSYTMSLYERS
ncbi:MAG: hypothetical protein IJ111_13255 [Eggerthellaceae bacterium]|nr:hypothetical protein [Eggerthellaceae bacterium]